MEVTELEDWEWKLFCKIEREVEFNTEFYFDRTFGITFLVKRHILTQQD